MMVYSHILLSTEPVCNVISNKVWSEVLNIKTAQGGVTWIFAFDC